MPPPFLLNPILTPRIWGRHNLAPLYPHHPAEKTGEAWLTADACTLASGQTLAQAFPRFPLLIKILFPDEKLSVQVHPDESAARTLGNGALPKTECWYILDAAPGASVALGFRPGTTRADIEKAAGTPAFEALLNTLPVHTGDMIYVPAGTVHAIGGGLTILEIQQPSHTTFRLFDYDRPRDLHLDEGVAVTHLETPAGRIAPTPIPSGHRLIAVPHFTVDRLDLAGTVTLEPTPEPQALITLSNLITCTTDAPDAAPLTLPPGQALIVPPDTAKIKITGNGPFFRCQAPI